MSQKETHPFLSLQGGLYHFLEVREEGSKGITSEYQVCLQEEGTGNPLDICLSIGLTDMLCPIVSLPKENTKERPHGRGLWMAWWQALDGEGQKLPHQRTHTLISQSQIGVQQRNVHRRDVA